jgi:hypothetical protein
MPPLQSLVALHGLWALALFAVVLWALWKWPTVCLVLVGCAVATLGAAGLAVIIGTELLQWYRAVPPTQQQYIVQRILYALGNRDSDHRAGLPLLRLRSVQACRRHYPGGIVSGAVAHGPATMPAFTFRSRFGSRVDIFEACSAFTHITACLFARSPEATPSTRGSDGFVTSTAGPIATGRSDPVAGRDSHPQDLSAFPRRTSKSVSLGGDLGTRVSKAGA